MSDDFTPRLGLPYLAAAQAQKHVTLNEALALLDGLVSTAVESRSTAAEPASPADGALYILPASATGGVWAGRPAGALMRFEAGAWTLLAPTDGQLAWVRDEAAMLVRAAGAWTPLASFQNLALLGVGTTANAGNPLSVRGPAALFTNAGAGMQLKLNKATAADTASLLFQTGFSGRAEAGLCGDDRLHVKVSADGAAWTEALLVQADGRVGIGATPTSRLQVEGALRVKSYAKAALPGAASEGAGAMIYVSDDALGATLAFSDGSAWRRVHDRAVVA
jgi:hypothetical protein